MNQVTNKHLLQMLGQTLTVHHPSDAPEEGAVYMASPEKVVLLLQQGLGESFTLLTEPQKIAQYKKDMIAYNLEDIEEIGKLLPQTMSWKVVLVWSIEYDMNITEIKLDKLDLNYLFASGVDWMVQLAQWAQKNNVIDNVNEKKSLNVFSSFDDNTDEHVCVCANSREEAIVKILKHFHGQQDKRSTEEYWGLKNEQESFRSLDEWLSRWKLVLERHGHMNVNELLLKWKSVLESGNVLIIDQLEDF